MQPLPFFTVVNVVIGSISSFTFVYDSKRNHVKMCLKHERVKSIELC